MKKPNSELKQRTALTDDKGNFIEFIGSKGERRKELGRIIGAYCRQLRSAMTENQ